MLIIVICLLTEKKSINLKPIIKMITHFCLGNISNGFGAIESREVSLKGICKVF